MNDTSTVATRAETVAAILAESGRPGKVPIRKSFVQQGKKGHRGPGPLAAFVGRGRELALDQYLLLLAWASAPPHDVRRDSRIWARALGYPDDPAGRQAVSRNWRFLRELGLVSAVRRGRLAEVTLLKEDGTRAPYSHPGKQSGDPYLTLDFAYWSDGHYQSLTLAGKAMLLVALGEKPGFTLAKDRSPGWYGLSPSTVERGLRELRRADILSAQLETRKAPLAPEGFTRVNVYSLKPPFGRRPPSRSCRTAA